MLLLDLGKAPHLLTIPSDVLLIAVAQVDEFATVHNLSDNPPVGARGRIRIGEWVCMHLDDISHLDRGFRHRLDERDIN